MFRCVCFWFIFFCFFFVFCCVWFWDFAGAGRRSTGSALFVFEAPCILACSHVFVSCLTFCFGSSREALNWFCDRHGFVGWFETSAKLNINIEEASHFLVEKVLEKMPSSGVPANRLGLKVRAPRPPGLYILFRLFCTSILFFHWRVFFHGLAIFLYILYIFLFLYYFFLYYYYFYFIPFTLFILFSLFSLFIFCVYLVQIFRSLYFTFFHSFYLKKNNSFSFLVYLGYLVYVFYLVHIFHSFYFTYFIYFVHFILVILFVHQVFMNLILLRLKRG